MAGGTKGRKRAPGQAQKATGVAKRERKPALGNDPFLRGAAAPEAGPSAPSQRALQVPGPTPAPPEAVPVRTVRGEAAARVEEMERKVEAALGGLEERLAELAARTGLGGGRDLHELIGRIGLKIAERLAAAKDLVKLFEPGDVLDPYGMDPRLVERSQPLLDFLYSTWWRVEVRSAIRLPPQGPAIVVANHAGLVPWDALVLRQAARREARRELRPLLDDRECDLPLVGGAAVRLGAVRASPEAAMQLLRAGDLVGVFPEGSAGGRKPWRERYRVQRFGRGGFVKIALATGAPIVPCAIVGSEEAAPAISRPGWLAERLGLPTLGGTSFLQVAPAAFVPLPSKWTLRFAEPVDVADHGPAAAGDAALVNEIAERVRSAIQRMLDEDVAARASVFL